MIHSSSLATLVVASRLCCDVCTGFSSEEHADGLDGDKHGYVTDRRDSVDHRLYVASIVLAIAFSVATTPIVDDLDVRVRRTRRARLHGRRKSRKSLQLPSKHKWDDVPELSAYDDLESSSNQAHVREESRRLSTRRQRRVHDTSSRNYSDFCDNALSRQIEAMTSYVEKAYENRHVEESKHVINQSFSSTNLIVNGLKRSDRIREARSMSNMHTLTRPPKNPLSDEKKGWVFQPIQRTVVKSTKDSNNIRKNNSFHLKAAISQPVKNTTLKLTKDVNIVQGKTHFDLLRRTLQPIQTCNDVPAMTPCDSLASFSSDYSLGSRSSADFLSYAPTKRAGNVSRRGNAEWAIIE